MEKLSQNKVQIAMWAMFVMILGLLVPDLFRPFVGVDSWRNAQTFSVARNIVEEGFSIFPRFDLRGLQNGIFPAEFPLQGMLLGFLMKVFGISITLGRLFSFILTIFSGFLIYKILELKSYSKELRLFGMVLFLTNTVIACQSVSIMPEAFVNFLSLASLYAYFSIEGQKKRIPVTLVLLILAGLVKPPGYLVVGMFLPLFLNFGKMSKLDVFELVTYFILPFSLIIFWKEFILGYENFVYNVSHPMFHHYHRNISLALSELNFQNIYMALKKTVYLGVGIPGIILGIFVIIKKQLIPLFKEKDMFHLGLWGWIGVNFAFLLYAGDVQAAQSYYATPIALPLTMLFVVWAKRLSLSILLPVLCAVAMAKTSFTFYRHYYSTRPQWNEARKELNLNKFSSRSDLFFVFPNSQLDSTELGKMGRRGYGTSDLNVLKKKLVEYDFLALKRTFDFSKVEGVANLEIVYEDGDYKYYKVLN